MGDAPRQLTIVRHADAGNRSRFDGPDLERPITTRGWAQARALADVLAEVGATAIVSSPALRCVETVTPLSERIGVGIEPADALSEDSTGEAALAALIARGDETGGLVIGSTHGPIFEDLLRRFGTGSGASRRRPVAKAGRLELSISGGEIAAFETFPAPKVEG
jgi:phosphohistidine phosphatase SixA